MNAQVTPVERNERAESAMVTQGLISPDDPHNRALVENVHPPDWVNPTPAGRYNLVVIGAGTAGLISAVGAAGLGAKVAIVEKHLMGGDCLNFGCVPSKALLRAARAVHAVRRAAEFGMPGANGMVPDFTAAMARMRQLRARISSKDSAHRLSQLGVDVFIGDGHFVARDAIEVGGQRLGFSRAVIATGARATVPAITGLSDTGFLTNETVFSLTELPRRLTVVGAGPIGCELAQAFRRFGSQVTIVSLDPRLLPNDDPDAAATVSRQLQLEGITLELGAKVVRAERTSDGRAVVFERDGLERRVVADQILVAVGRTPNTEGLGLDAGGITYDRTGVLVDERLRTSNSRVFAAGDICSKYKFTHAADAMARIALQNALFFGQKKQSALVIPWCTYTDPELAHVGLSESEARERGSDVATYTVPLNEVDRAILDGEETGFARVHVERKSGRILGATAVAAHGGEMIGQMALAMTAGISIGTVSNTIVPYPTQIEAWKRLGDSWNRSRLTSVLRRFLERYFGWRR